MPKVSIVIPTRERAEYLHYSIQTALAIDDADIEILINDNFTKITREKWLKPLMTHVLFTKTQDAGCQCVKTTMTPSQTRPGTI